MFNPKAAIFFLAFLPQFVDPAAGLPVWLQFLALGTIVNLTFSSADLLTIFLTSAVLKRVRRAGMAERIARLIGGSLLIGLGARLAVSRD
jgi:threonine/homoserine/homoserine lactone efflux protein